MKKIFFYFFSFFLLISFLSLTDIILSNTILKQNHCKQYEEYFYKLKKNCKGKYRFKKSFPIVETYTDEMGLRVGKLNKPKDKSKKNVFIFGDSFAYGSGIEYEKTFAGLIANDLSNYNVLNFGVGSYSPSVYLHQLQKTLEKGIKPEKILIFLDLTDVMDEALRWTYNDMTGEVRLFSNYLYLNSKKKENFWDKNFKVFKNLSSYLNYNFRLLKERSNIQFNNQRKIKTSIQGSFTYTKSEMLDKRFWKSNALKNGISNIEKRLLQIKKITKKNNIQFYLVIYPWAETLVLGQKEFNWTKFANKICFAPECTLINSIPAFTEYKNLNKNWSTELYFINDEHFNEQGAYLLYKTVMEFIRQ